MISSFDITVLVILLILLARGFWVGFIRQIASILALVLGFVVAGRYCGESADLVLPFISNPQIAFLISYGVIFLLVLFGVTWLGIGLKKVISIALLGWFDRTVGGLFGLAKGVFVASLLFMLIAAFLSSANTLFAKSIFAPYLEQSSQFILNLVKDEDLRMDFLPSQPAISTILSNSVKIGKDIKRDSQ
ncbi:MAG: CvpA family protein [Desulfobulbaceae bacterium]|nr:CvpA family protein [Desulfobulbaceae bacterium]